MLKLKRTPGIYLVGFMGSGKTTIGRLLAERLGWSFADLDADIETQQDLSISELFETRGEEEFRRLESEAVRARVRSIECGRPMVIALGGGTFVQEQNVDLLENNGVTVWLDCPFPLVRQRVENSSHRPLARDSGKFEDLYNQRRQAYSRADFRIPIEGDNPLLAVEAVLALPLFR